MPMASTSIAAYRSVDISEMEQKVLDVIEVSGIDGCISDEIQAAYPTLSYSTVTARFSSLEAKGEIYRAGDTRPGVSGRQQKVMRVAIHAASVPTIRPTKVAIKKNPFLLGMMFATKIVKREPDLASARQALKRELLKAAGR